MHATADIPVRSKRRGFTLVEALVSTSIIAIAGTSLLLGVASSLETTTYTLERAIGAGMAQQLMDEIAAQRYHEPGESPTSLTLGPEPGESGVGRTAFDDIDDYNGYVSQPPVDRYGKTLGLEDDAGGLRVAAARAAELFANWRQEVIVHYTSESSLDTPSAAATYYRTVHVRIVVDDPARGMREVAHLTSIFTYVPGS